MQRKLCCRESVLMLLEASLSHLFLVPGPSELLLGSFGSLLSQTPSLCHLSGWICGCCPVPLLPPARDKGSLPGLPVRSPDIGPPELMPPTCLLWSPAPRATPFPDHSLPQLPNHTYLLPPSLPLPCFCLVTERHLGMLPRLELANCTVPRNVRQSGRAAGLPGYAWQTPH